MAADRSTVHGSNLDIVAGNGLLHRRMFLTAGTAAAAAVASSVLPNPSAADALPVEPWMKLPGSGFAGYGQPSKYEQKVARTWNTAPGTTGAGAARTPHHLLNGMITPNGVHFERSHSGIPDINPDTHRLVIHGLVKCAEWTGVKLSVLLQEAGVDPKATWILAEGADAAGMSRSVPLAKAMDDALIALYQNGERVRPSNGYPMRLLMPGYEGNMNVKWLRRIKLTEGPTMTKDETSKYTITLHDGKSLQFVLPQEGKSVITQPSPGLTMNAAGLYEISGLAWSGYGKISKVEVSADGGKSWAPAALQQPVLSMALTRFRMAWHWIGGPAVLQSRATDDTGYLQPTRAELIANSGTKAFYHFNGITSWGIAENGEVKHVYA